MNDRWIELDGLRFRYRVGGADSQPALLLLHRLGGDAGEWDAVAEALVDRFRVIALDQRGHGKSARADSYSFEAMRDDVCRFVDALELARFSIIGHSMGGTVAFLVAQAFGTRIDRLVIEDTPPPQGGTLPEPPAEPPTPVPYDWAVVRGLVPQLNHPDPQWWDRLVDIHARTLIVGGGSSSPIAQERLAEVARRIPRARLVTIEGGGHFVHATKPGEFIAHVRPFLLEA